MSTSEKRKADKLSEDEIADREEVAADFFNNAVKIRTAERRLRELKKKQKSLLAKHPFLSNSVGALHKGAFDTPPAKVKKQKTDEDHKMEEVPKGAVIGSSKGRLAKLILQKHHLAQQEGKQQQGLDFEGSKFNK